MTTISKIIQSIKDKRYQRYLISTHVRPDIDALSSELAIAAYLRRLRKEVDICNAERAAKMYDFLPGVTSIRCHQGQNRKYDVAIIVDCGDLERIGQVSSLIRPEKLLINIDHHVTNDHFGDLNLVDVHASSTAEIIFELLKEARFPINKSIAQLLYLGIMTDTGSFRYDNTTSKTHRVVSELMKHRFSVHTLYRKIYETIPLEDIELFTNLIARYQIFQQGKVVCVDLPQGIVDRFSESFDLRDKIFTFLRAIRGVEVIAILTKEGKNSTRVNLRSQGKVDVAKVASAFSGGGHQRASGGKIALNLSSAKKVLLTRIAKEFKKA